MLPEPSPAPRILVFDSGMGGLTVSRAIGALMPEACLVYAADNAAFPYGAWEEAPLIERIVAVLGVLIDAVRPDIAVVACNTASTLALRDLRTAYPDIPFVGTVPAIKPAAAATKSGVVGVLATPGTVAREYTKALIDTFAFHCTVILHGAENLARMAEESLNGTRPAAEDVRREIRPVFRRRNGARTDTVVLGCTHYPLLLDEITAAAPWPVTFIDPAPAIARRVVQVLGEGGTRREGFPVIRPHTVIFTAQPLLVGILDAYARFGFDVSEILSRPVIRAV